MNRLNYMTRRAAGLLAALLLVAGSLGMVGCNGSNGDEASEDGPRYSVGEPVQDSTVAIIVSSDYGADTLTAAAYQGQMQRIAQQAPRMGMDPSDMAPMRRILVESFVERHVLSGEAEQAGLAVDSAALNQQIEAVRGQFGSEEQFQQMLQQQGLTMDSLRRAMREQMRMQMLQQQLAEEAETPTEDEIEDFRQEQAQQVSAQHILFPLPPDASEQAQDSVSALAEAVLDSVEAGADFAALARRHSQDGSASRGGDLGYFSQGQMVEPFAEAAFALADSGDVTSEPVRSDFGYHLIRKTGERTATPMDTARARRAIVQERQRETLQEGLNRLRAKATVRINPVLLEGVNLEEVPPPLGR